MRRENTKKNGPGKLLAAKIRIEVVEERGGMKK